MDKNINIEETLVLAKKGDMEAQFNMGVANLNGIEVSNNGELKVVEQNYSKAFEWFTKAAEQGYADAQNSLGLMHKKGLAVPQNDYEAFEWFTKADEQNHADAQNNMGLIYRDGKETPMVVYMMLHDFEINETEPSPQDYERIFTDFGLDCPSDLDYRSVAESLSQKRGVDHEKALIWFTKAAFNGSDAAQENLNIIFDNKNDYK